MRESVYKCMQRTDHLVGYQYCAKLLDNGAQMIRQMRKLPFYKQFWTALQWSSLQSTQAFQSFTRVVKCHKHCVQLRILCANVWFELWSMVQSDEVLQSRNPVVCQMHCLECPFGPSYGPENN